MKTLTLLICIYLGVLVSTEAAPLLKPDDRLAICGDGTSDPGYAASLEAYLLLSQPIRRTYLEDFNWSAPTASGFLARLDTDLVPYKPTVVLTNFGIGANSDKPLDDATAAAYRKDQTDLVDALKKNGARLIIVGSPKCVDSTLYHNNPAQAATTNKTLGALADIDKDVAAQEGVVYADVFGATMTAMTQAKTLYGNQYEFDTGGFGSPCSMVLTYAYLKALGCTGDIGSVTVNNLARGNIRLSPGQYLTFDDKTMRIESSLFPFSWDRGGDATHPDIAKCFPFEDELNRYTLVVKNLTCAHAKVTWGDENHDFTSAELAAGINLPKEFSRTPFNSLFEGATRASYDRQQQERATGAASIGHPEILASRKSWDDLLQNTISSLVYVTRSVQRQRLAIQPLVEPDPQPPGPIPVIIDTDLDGDVDDVGALALLNSFMDQGEANLIACVHNTREANLSSCATIQAINAYYGHPSIPIGQSYGEKGPATPMTSILSPAPADGYHSPEGPYKSNYALQIHQRFDPTFPDDNKMPAGVDVYRKVLAAAADGSVVICSVGSMENLQDLIQSQPDSVSSLSGLDLVKKKVRLMTVMANTVPQDHYILSKWPTKIMWTTYVGSSIYTGPSLLKTPENNPVRVAYDLFGVLHNGRQSWDLTAAWLAVRGPGDVFDVVAGRPQYINDITHSLPVPHPDECEVTIKMPYPEVSKLIGDQLTVPPKP
jgi:lysophospholipase L1-like esterase